MIRLNAHVPIANLVMAYYDAEVEEYVKVRDYVCAAFKIHYCVYFHSRAAGLSINRIFYMNPLVDCISQAPVVIFLEAHQGSSRRQNAIACAQLMEPGSLVLAESTKSITAEKAPLAGVARDSAIENYELLSCPVDTQFSGWDYSEAPWVTFNKTAATILAKRVQLKQNAAQNAVELMLLNDEIDLAHENRDKALSRLESDQALLGNTALFADFSLRNQFLVHSIKYAVLQIFNGNVKGKALLFTGVHHIKYSDFEKTAFFIPIVKAVKAVHDFLKTCPCIVLYPIAIDADLARSAASR